MSKFQVDQDCQAGTASLILAGQALYGARWQTDLARDLGLSDGRRIRQWLTGDRPIPAGVWTHLANLLMARKVIIDDAFKKLKKLAPTTD